MYEIKWKPPHNCSGKIIVDLEPSDIRRVTDNYGCTIKNCSEEMKWFVVGCNETEVNITPIYETRFLVNSP